MPKNKKRPLGEEDKKREQLQLSVPAIYLY